MICPECKKDFGDHIDINFKCCGVSPVDPRTNAHESLPEFLEEKSDPLTVMKEMIETFKKRSKAYGDNYKKIGQMMVTLYPHGLALNGQKDFDVFSMFVMIMVKLTRFAESDLKHKDSIHDLAIYAAMLESLL